MQITIIYDIISVNNSIFQYIGVNMSKILAIIAEYNPFHNGHLYHLQKSKKDIIFLYALYAAKAPVENAT